MFIDLIEPCCSMAQSKMESSRLKVDPTIGVMDLQKVLKHHVDNAPDRNIWNILKHPTGAPFSWKTSACLPWIAEAADLLIDFLKIAPNGLLPASKLRLSLSRLLTDGTEKTKKVNRTNYHTDDWVDQVDSRIRILLSQVRSLKKHEDYVRAMRRATESEKRKIDSVLSYVRMARMMLLVRAEQAPARLPRRIVWSSFPTNLRRAEAQTFLRESCPSRTAARDP